MTGSRKRLYNVLLSLTLLVATGYIFFSFILSEVKDIQILRGERDAHEELLGKERSTIETVSRLLGEYQDIGDIRRNLSLVLPTEERIPDIIHQLQGISRTSDVTINSLELQILPIRSRDQDAVIRSIGTVRVTISLFGAYENIRAYIGAIQTNIRIMDIHSLRIDGGADIGGLTHIIVVDVYYQK